MAELERNLWRGESVDVVLGLAARIQSLGIGLHLFEFHGLVVEASKDVVRVAQIQATTEEAEQELLSLLLVHQLHIQLNHLAFF